MSSDQTTVRSRRIWGTILLLMGAFLAAVSVGLVEADESSFYAPRWILLLAGAAVVSTGLLLLVENSRARDVLAAVFSLSLGATGVWVSLFSSSEGISGGIFFLPRDVNVRIARVFFGLGAIIAIAFAAYAFRRALRRDA